MIARVLLLFVLLSVPLSACVVTVDKADYAAYRRIRLANDPQTRARAMRDYVTAHPNGRWARQVRHERSADEWEMFERRKGSVAGLRAFLRAYPDGRYAAQAKSRLRAVALTRARKQREQERAERIASVNRERMEAERRKRPGNAVLHWARALVTLQGGGSTLSDVVARNAEFRQSYGRPPTPICTPTVCTKSFQTSFAIPVPGATRIERVLKMILRLHLRDGRLVRAELLLPNRGFSRLFELERQEPVVDADPTDRQRALDASLSRLDAMLREAAQGARPVEPVALPIEPLATSSVAASPAAPLVLPLGLIGLADEERRIGVFAAAAEDEGDAFDGLFVEWVGPSAAPTGRPRRAP